MWFIKSVDGSYIAIQNVHKLDYLKTTRNIAEAKRFTTKAKAEAWVKPLLRFWACGTNPEFVHID